jgi:hypothetical protein
MTCAHRLEPSREAGDVLKPHPVFAIGLAAGAAIFGWLTVTEAIPRSVSSLARR